MYNAFIMDLPVSSFVSCLSLLTAKGIDLGVVRDGLFPSVMEIVRLFIVATLIAGVLFKQFLICNAV